MTAKIQPHPLSAPLSGGINFRDMGGNRGADGRLVKPGCLFRSGALHRLTEADCDYLRNLNVVRILDYRDNDEVQSKPDVLWPGACYIHAPANPLSTEVSANLDSLNNDTLQSFDSQTFMLELYRRLPFNNLAYQKLVNLLQQPDSGGLVQHCAVGKDRTGVGSALILMALGADKQTVMEDYLLTETTLEPYRQQIFCRLSTKLNDRGMDQLTYIMAAREEFLATSLQAIEERYGSINRWLEREFALDAVRRQALQQHYLAE